MKIYKTVFLALLALVFVACNTGQQAGSPTESFKEYFEASQKKEVEKMRLLLSAETLKMLQNSAQKQNTTVEELLRRDDPSASKNMPETRNEKIDGDTATLEVKNSVTPEWDEIPFVKEDGKWKIALDKYMQDLKTKEEMRRSNIKTMPMDTVNSNDSSAANK